MKALRIHSTMTDNTMYFLSSDESKLSEIANEFKQTEDLCEFFDKHCSRNDVIYFDDCMNVVEFTETTAFGGVAVIEKYEDGKTYAVDSIATINSRF